jgi:hypothetical protein
MAALQGRRLGWSVEVLTDRISHAGNPVRIECVPAQIVALLVEFGVHPKTIGVDRLFERRGIAWERSSAEFVKTPMVAHIGRPALDIALLESAIRAGVKIHVEHIARADLPGLFDGCGKPLVVDATGRAAITARRRIQPPIPYIARIFRAASSGYQQWQEFAIAAGPDGYAYRLGNAHFFTLGVVGRGGLVKGVLAQIIDRVTSFAPWLVDGIPKPNDFEGEVSAGIASMQWTDATQWSALPIGDAAFARDALSSQGLAIGMSEALNVVKHLCGSGSEGVLSAHDAQRYKHIAQVMAMTRTCRFADSPIWSSYGNFLSQQIAKENFSGP